MSLRPTPPRGGSVLTRGFSQQLSLFPIAMKRENDDGLARESYALVITFDKVDTFRSLGSPYERVVTMSYEKAMLGGEPIESVRPMMQASLQKAARQHQFDKYEVRSEPFAHAKDLTSCPELSFEIQYRPPVFFSPESFQNEIIETMTSRVEYEAFRDFGCARALSASVKPRVRYELL